MSQCDAVVVETSGGVVWVEVPARASACGNCKTPDVCQSGLLGLSAGPRRYRLDNLIGARVGDRVSLTVADGTLWRASVASYVLPLLLAIGGAVIGQSIGGDVWAVMGTMIGIGAGLALLRRKEIRARHDASLFSLQVQTREVRFKEKS
ncbi:MAG: SoxR reducing system RseC family protein [Sulfuritalea sp.]|jgi:sigma-E factor negative regulatory protein RseC|nr:SoxR reducing system RseC family protein [Sulfuritalea sp.]